MKTKILSPLRRDGYKAGMIMMLIALSTMLLTTACSNQDDIANTSNITNKGYALPVTVNVTRQDGATRATFDGSKLNFSAGDKLFVNGQHSTAGQFAGTLEYDAVSGKFSGTIYTQNGWTGTADALFTESSVGGGYYAGATLLPDGYGSTGFLDISQEDVEKLYDDRVPYYYENAFALTKAAGVEQLSREEAGYYNNGFVLMPNNAILNFTITGLAASTEVAVVFTESYYSTTINKNVTTDGSGNATFAIGLSYGVDFANCALTVGGLPITLVSSSKVLAAGKIYNITRVANAINGKFSVSATKQVYFSKGNLRYASGTWSFFNNQYDYYTSYSADARDKFGWSTSANTYGMNTSTYSGDFVDWGATMGTGWFTLDSDEWAYLFNTRSASTVNGTDNGRYAKAKVNNVQGVILFPDTYTHPAGVTAPAGVNATDNTGWNGNNYTVADWTKMESAGCVFLPAAGYRNGSSVYYSGTLGYYWSATPYDTGDAYIVDFNEYNLYPASNSSRSNGFSVRLVREVTE